MSIDKNKLLRNIPSIDEIIRNQEVSVLFEKFPREMVLNAVKLILDDRRKNILKL